MSRKKKNENSDEVVITKKEETPKSKPSEYSQLSEKGKKDVGSSIQFWGKRELNRRGEPMSAYPQGYNQRIVTELEEELRHVKRGLEYDAYPPAERDQQKARLKDLEDNLKDIKALAEGTLTGVQKDLLAECRRDFAEVIAQFEPTYDEMHRGTVNAQELMKKNKGYCIDVPMKYRGIVENLGGKLYNGKMRGDDYKRVWKIISRRLGEDSNVETLRRPGGASGVYKSEHELTSLVLDRIRKGHMREIDPEYAEWLDKKKDK